MTNSNAQTGSANHRKILVVDDEHRLAESLAQLLRASGYQVAAATTGSKGLETIKQEHFDLLITDLRMEGVDGFDLMHYVSENCPNTAMIVITGHASTESAIEALHQRVADYITKPFDYDFLRAAIDKVFARQEAEQLRRDLVSMLTHDIKVPLTSVVGFAQLIIQKDGSINPNTPQCVEHVIINSQRILAMLDNYLTNSRAEEGRLEILRLPIQLQDTLEEAVSLLTFEFRRKNLTIEQDYSGITQSFNGDEPLLFRAFSNLLSNAAKYTPHEGTVRISATTEKNRVIIRVSNTGASLSDLEASTIFGRYTRARSAKGIEGTGLGLHVVSSITQAHGGHASCRSENGVVTFTLSLPIVEQD